MDSPDPTLAANPPSSHIGAHLPNGNLSRELAGDLPCIHCGYNLKGLTVRGMCPECGVSVRTTLLAVVDPRAREFRRVENPRAVAWGVMLWSGAASLACVLVWLLQMAYVFRLEASFAARSIRMAEWGVWVCSLGSGVGACALIRPHSGLSVRSVILAILGVIAYFPLLWVVYTLYVSWGASLGSAFSSAAMEARAPWRLAASAAGLVILIGLRPNARALQARWLLMRLGAVTRQTMLAMVIVVLVWVAADTMVLTATRFHGGLDEIIRLVAKLLILVGALFLTVGVFSIAMDCWHIRAVVLRPPMHIDQLLRHVEKTGTSVEKVSFESPTTPSAVRANGWSGP